MNLLLGHNTLSLERVYNVKNAINWHRIDNNY
jgi:hypothetical protein